MRGNLRAHRFSWELHNGKIPPDICVLHKCDTPACVRPDHLFLGTQLDNVKDMLAKKRNVKGTMVPQSKINEQVARNIKNAYIRGKTTMEQVAAMFGTNADVVWTVVNGVAWRWLWE